MQGTMEPMVVIKKIAMITAIGFAALVLSGPAIALIGTVLPFFLVGCVFYLIYQALVLGPRIAFGMVRGVFSLIWKIVFGIPAKIFLFFWYLIPNVFKRVIGFVFALPIGILRCFGRGVRGIASLIGNTIGFGFRVLGEAFAGGVVGGILGVLGGMEHHDMEMRVPLGIAMGLVIGALAGAVRTKPKQISAPAQQPVLLAQAIGPEMVQVCRPA